MPDESLPPTAERSPQKKMGEAEKAKLRAFLTGPECPRKPDGSIDRAMAAKLTGLTYGCVDRFIARDAYFTNTRPEANTEKLVPTEAKSIDPKVARMPPVTPEQAALFRQSKIVSEESWKQAGLGDLESALMSRHNRLGKVPIGDLIGAVSGGLVADLAKLNLKLEILGDRLLNRDKSTHGDLPKIFDREGNDVTELEWERIRLAMLAEKRALMSALVKQQVSIQTAERLFKENFGENTKPRATFGGKPLQVVAQPGSKVLVQNGTAHG